jgi:hypothetical protein
MRLVFRAFKNDFQSFKNILILLEEPDYKTFKARLAIEALKRVKIISRVY